MGVGGEVENLQFFKKIHEPVVISGLMMREDMEAQMGYYPGEISKFQSGRENSESFKSKTDPPSK